MYHLHIHPFQKSTLISVYIIGQWAWVKIFFLSISWEFKHLRIVIDEVYWSFIILGEQSCHFGWDFHYWWKCYHLREISVFFVIVIFDNFCCHFCDFLVVFNCIFIIWFDFRYFAWILKKFSEKCAIWFELSGV